MLSSMSRLKVRTRFMFLGAMALLLAAVPSAMYLFSSYRITQGSQLEVRAVAPNRALISLISLLQRHRGLTVLVDAGHGDMRSTRDATSQAIDAGFKNLSAVLGRTFDQTDLVKSLRAEEQDWHALQRSIADRELGMPQRLAQHTRLIEQLLKLSNELNYDAGYVTDQGHTTHALIDLAILAAPVLIEDLGKTRDMGGQLHATRVSNHTQLHEFGAYLARAKFQQSRLEQELSELEDTDTALHEIVLGPSKEALELTQAAFSLADQMLIDPQAPGVSDTAYWAMFSRAIDAQLSMSNRALDQLELLLNDRLARQDRNLLLMLVAMLVMAGLGLGVGIAAALSITRQIGGEPAEVMALANAVAQGDLSTVISVARGTGSSILGAMSDMRAALRASKERYQHLIQHMPLGVMITQNGMIKFCNPMAIEMTGYTRDELTGHSFLPLIHEDDRARTLETHARRMRGEIDFGDYEIRALRKNGLQRLWRLRVQTIHWDGGPAGLTILTDNTEARKAEIHLRELSNIVEQTTDAIMLTDADGTIKYVNPGFENLSGWRRNEVLGKKPSLFKSGAHDENFYRQLWNTISAGHSFHGHVTNRHKNGSDYHVFKTITPMLDANGAITSYVNIDKDFGIQHAVQERLTHQALNDSLTGLPNRFLLEDRIRQSIARHPREPAPFALLFIDLDDFKEVNDRLGHDAGDEVLKQVATRLSANTRPMDTVARLGGDEFVVLLQGVAELDQAHQVARKLVNAINAPIDFQGEACQVGASIGVSRYPADALDLQALMSRADAAMYRAKRAGGNRFDDNGEPPDQPGSL